MKDKTVIFYAPVGTNLPQHLVGGGEVGCRRTREVLMAGGYKVITIDKPTMGNGAFNYIKLSINGYFKIWKNSLLNRKAIFYVVGFYEKNIYLEWIIVVTSKLLQHKTIYEARNGRLLISYLEYGKIYESIMDSVLKKADKVFCQGLEYVEFIKFRHQKESVYTPNYVLNKNLQKYNENRPREVIRLIYFGRVTDAKKIHILIEICGLLLKRGHRTEAVIIGAYQEEYKKILDQHISDLNIPDGTIQFLGQQHFENISAQLQKAHFFVFPSQEKKEGHSNALTEAMTFGVVPVVSLAGFNSSIVGKPELVVSDLDAEKYVDVIEKIILERSWQEYSKFVFNRVKENYTEDIVKKSILTEIDDLSKKIN